MDEMALALDEKIRLDTCFALNDGSHVLMTLSVNNVVRLFKLKLPNFNF